MRRTIAVCTVAALLSPPLWSPPLWSSPLWSQDPTPPSPELECPAVDKLDVELDRQEKGVAGKLLDEIQDNMREVERLLARKETGALSQARQVEAIEQIEKLIVEMNKT